MFYETVGALKEALRDIDDNVGIAIPDMRITSSEYDEIKDVEVCEIYYDGSRYFDDSAVEDWDAEEMEGLEKVRVVIIS